MKKKIFGLLFFSILLILPTLSFSDALESIPLRFESMGIQIFTADDTLPKAYTSISLLAVSGKDFYSLLQDISKKTREINGDAIIILNMTKNGQEFVVFAKVIKTK